MEEKQIAVFKKEVRRKEYYFSPSDYTWRSDRNIERRGIDYTTHFIKYELLGEYEIDKPPFIVSEQVYLDDLDKIVTISTTCRSTNGKYIYIINESESVEDEKTIESYDKALKNRMDYIKKIEEDEARIKLQQSKLNSKKWYEFWK